MLTINHIGELQQQLSGLPAEVKVGFVPTMGALHLGHQSLIKMAIAETDFVVVSIFVNPLQFGENEDLEEYPRQLADDRQICDDLGVNILFTPSAEEMNPLNAETTLVVPPPSMTSVLCGAYRVRLFPGVATIVTKFLNLVRPQIAYFGQKDAQQVAIIKRIVQDLSLPVTIKSCPIIREKSGLALSSRNQYLTSAAKQEATLIYRSLSFAQQLFYRERETQTIWLKLSRTNFLLVL